LRSGDYPVARFVPNESLTSLSSAFFVIFEMFCDFPFRRFSLLGLAVGTNLIVGEANLNVASR
jgi:hypothetical protein